MSTDPINAATAVAAHTIIGRWRADGGPEALIAAAELEDAIRDAVDHTAFTPLVFEDVTPAAAGGPTAIAHTEALPQRPSTAADVERLLVAAVKTARRLVHTEPDHAAGPNHRADEWVADLLTDITHRPTL